MNTFRSKPFGYYLPPAILAISLLAVYLATLAPGLSWAHDGRDGGDLITATATGGVAHPTGYPLYLLLAGLFQRLPVGSLAFRTNLMSAIAAVLAALLLYSLVIRSLDPVNTDPYWPAGMVAGFAFGLAPLVWSQVVITEVYALQSLLIVLILYLATLPILAWKRRDQLCGLTLGLAMGNHITTILLAPIVLFAEAFQQPQDWRSAARRSAFFVAGLAIYLILPLRASANPPVNWGNPVTVQRLWWLVSGQLYSDYLFPIRTIADVSIHVQAWASLLLGQWGILGLLLAFIGLAYYFSPSRLYLFTIWQAIVYSMFAILYGASDSYVYLLPVCISFSIWIGIGLARLTASNALRSPRLGVAISSLFLIYLFGLAASHWSQVDASHDLRAEAFGQQILETAPSDALLFAEGDEAVFTAWYVHFALGQRPDLVVIAKDLLHFDWYLETLHKVYPSLKISQPLPWAETIIYDNPSRPVCTVRSNEGAVIDCEEPRE